MNCLIPGSWVYKMNVGFFFVEQKVESFRNAVVGVSDEAARCGVGRGDVAQRFGDDGDGPTGPGGEHECAVVLMLMMLMKQLLNGGGNISVIILI